MNIGIGRGMIALFIHKENRVEDLHGYVCVHRGGDFGDASQIAINEFAQTYVIFHRAASAATANIKFEVWDTEGVLHVDQHEPGSGRIIGSRLKSVLNRPVTRLFRALLI